VLASGLLQGLEDLRLLDADGQGGTRGDDAESVRRGCGRRLDGVLARVNQRPIPPALDLAGNRSVGEDRLEVLREEPLHVPLDPVALGVGVPVTDGDGVGSRRVHGL